MHQSEKTARRDRTATLAPLLLLCFAATACASDPAAAPGATFTAGPFTIKPGEERVICTYVRSDNDETLNITRFVTEQTKGAHHIVVYDVDHPIDLPPTNCSQGGQPSWRPMIVSQIEHEEHAFPKGVGYRVAPHQQFVLETHYINTTDEPMVMSGTLSMVYAKQGEATMPAAIYGIGTMNIDIPPYSKWSTQVACSPPFEFTLQTMFGHEHAHGTGLRVEFARGGGAAAPLYSMTDWARPPIEHFDGGLKVVPGDTISVSCDWENDSPNRVRMPHEMCFALGYYWPAEGALSCMAGGQKDACLCGIQKPTEAEPGPARLSVGVRRGAAIQGAIGELDTGAPIQCMLWRAEDWTGGQPTAGAQPRHVRDAIDVPLKTTADVATIDFDDVTPGDYVISCMMDNIGGGFMPGSGDIMNSVPARVTAVADVPGAASVVLDTAIP